MFTKSVSDFFNHCSIDSKHELVTSVLEDFNVLMLTACKFVGCHVNGR